MCHDIFNIECYDRASKATAIFAGDIDGYEFEEATWIESWTRLTRCGVTRQEKEESGVKSNIMQVEI